MKEDFKALNEITKQQRNERIAKTPQRVEYAIKRMEESGVNYKLLDESIGFFHCYKQNGKLVEFWAGTGKIKGQEHRRGIEHLIKMCTRKE